MNGKLNVLLTAVFFGIALTASSCSESTQQPAAESEKQGEEQNGPSAFEAGKSFTQQMKEASEKEKPIALSLEELPEVIAVVNGNNIDRKIFWRIINNIKSNLGRRGEVFTQATYDAVKKNVIDSIVNSELLSLESQKNNVTVEDSKVDVQFTLLHSQFPTEDDYKSFLEAQHVTEKQIKHDLKRGMVINKLLEETVVKNINVGESEARKYYDANREKYKHPVLLQASHILLKLEKDADEKKTAETQKRMEEILKEVNAGGDFAKIAKAKSEGPSATQGGDLGLFPKGAMVKEFEDAAFALKIGQVSGIIRTDFGLHIIKLMDRKEEGVSDFEELKKKIISNLKKLETTKAVEKYVEGLRGKADIKINI